MICIILTFILHGLNMVRRVVSFPAVCIRYLPVIREDKRRHIRLQFDQNHRTISQFIRYVHIRSFPPEDG